MDDLLSKRGRKGLGWKSARSLLFAGIDHPLLGYRLGCLETQPQRLPPSPRGFWLLSRLPGRRPLGGLAREHSLCKDGTVGPAARQHKASLPANAACRRAKSTGLPLGIGTERKCSLPRKSFSWQRLLEFHPTFGALAVPGGSFRANPRTASHPPAQGSLA